jgi:hypothetical protein
MGFGQLNEVNRSPEPSASTAMQSAIYTCTSIRKTQSLQISLNEGWHMNKAIAVFQGSGAAITTAYRTFFTVSMTRMMKFSLHSGTSSFNRPSKLSFAWEGSITYEGAGLIREHA